jgi:hypothetical protein
MQDERRGIEEESAMAKETTTLEPPRATVQFNQHSLATFLNGIDDNSETNWTTKIPSGGGDGRVGGVGGGCVSDSRTPLEKRDANTIHHIVLEAQRASNKARAQRSVSVNYVSFTNQTYRVDESPLLLLRSNVLVLVFKA